MQDMNTKVSAETTGTSEPERVADILAGRAEHLAVHLDGAMPSEQMASTVPSNGPGDRVPLRLADPLVEVEVADGVRHDG